MKNYKKYLMESDKKYGFRAKLAKELTEQQMDDLKRSMARWNLEAISEPKRTPISEKPQGFEHIPNTELYIVDLVVNYPCTPHEVQAAIHESTGMPLHCIMVMTPQQEVLAAPIVPESDEPVLTSDYPKSNGPQLLADLANALKSSTTEHQFAVKPEKGTTTNDLPQNTRGPLGMHKPKMPANTTGRRI
jgi:hypothetical protein